MRLAPIFTAFETPKVHRHSADTRHYGTLSQEASLSDFPYRFLQFEQFLCVGIRDGLPRQNAATLAHAAGGSQTLVGYLQAHLHHLQAGDYFCILAHIEMNATHHMLPQTMG
jgi:hypothetical protein